MYLLVVVRCIVDLDQCVGVFVAHLLLGGEGSSGGFVDLEGVISGLF